jgi:hypothetical protein
LIQLNARAASLCGPSAAGTWDARRREDPLAGIRRRPVRVGSLAYQADRRITALTRNVKRLAWKVKRSRTDGWTIRLPDAFIDPTLQETSYHDPKK